MNTKSLGSCFFDCVVHVLVGFVANVASLAGDEVVLDDDYEETMTFGCQFELACSVTTALALATQTCFLAQRRQPQMSLVFHAQRLKQLPLSSSFLSPLPIFT